MSWPREFPARFALLEPDALLPAAIDEARDLGFVLCDIDHASDRSSLFFRAALDKGVIRVPPPGPRDPPMSALASLVRAYDRMA